MHQRLRRAIVMASIGIILGVGGVALAPSATQAAPLEQYDCWGGPCPPPPGLFAGPPPAPWAGPPPVPLTYGDAVALTDYANLSNAIGYQNVVNGVVYQNLANAATYRNNVRIATWQALTNQR